MTKEPNNQFERFRKFARQIVSVPKAEVLRREAEYKKARKASRKART
jgi:hypothetical protein